MNTKVGTAPDNWGVWFPSDPRQTPWNRFLDEVVEAGYPWIELGPYGYLPTDLKSLRSELDRRGLKVCATFAMGHLEDPAAWPSLQKQVLGAGENLAALGAVRFDLKYGMPGMTHQQLMTNIELYGGKVIPRVRELLAAH